MIYEYGAMSSKYSCEAEIKLTAYATMCIHFNRSSHLIAIYAPESSKQDSWLSIDGKVAERLDEIFGGPGSFDKYIGDHEAEIGACCESIKRLV